MENIFRRNGKMTPLGEILPEILADMIRQSRSMDQEPPAFVTARFDRQPPPDKPPHDPSH